jgi:hypothetical protein
MKFSILLFVVLVVTACTPPSGVVTEPGREAFSADQVLERVERLQNAAIAAHKAGQLPTDTARAIVFATVQIAEFADAAQKDWRAMVRQAWVQARTEIPVLKEERFKLYVVAIDTLLGVLL